jgi:hypothetical protein
MSDEFEELKRKCQQYGINIDLILNEAERRVEARESAIAKRIIDSIPSLKPDIDAICKTVEANIKAVQVDTDMIKNAVVKEILARMPDTAAAERQSLMMEAAQQIKDYMGNIEQKIQPLIRPMVKVALDAEAENLVKQLRDEMAGQRAEFLEQLKAGGPNGKGSGKLGSVPWDQVLPVIEKMVEKDKDPFAGIDAFLNMRERILKLEPSGPDVGQQFNLMGKTLLEGVKLGARAKGVTDPKKLSSLPGGQSVNPAGSSGLHPAVERL